MNEVPMHLNPGTLARAVAEHSTKIPLPESGDLWTALNAASLVAPLQDSSPRRAREIIPAGQALAGDHSAGGYGPSPAYMAASKKVDGESVRFLRVFVSLEEKLATPRTGKSQIRATGRQLLTATPPGWGMQIVAEGVKHWISPNDVAREARLAAEQIARDQRGAAERWGLAVDPDVVESSWTPTTDGLEAPLERWIDTLGDIGTSQVRILVRLIGDVLEAHAWTQPPEYDELTEKATVDAVVHAAVGPLKGVGTVLPPLSEELVLAIRAGREHWARPGFGTWLSAMLVVDNQESCRASVDRISFRHVNIDQVPAFGTGISRADVLREQELHPRSAWWMPDWYLAALSLAGALSKDASIAALPSLSSGITLDEHLARVQDPEPFVPQPLDIPRTAETKTLGDFLRLRDELRDDGPEYFLARHRDELSRIAADFRNLAGVNPDEPVQGFGNLLDTAFRSIRDDRLRVMFVRELLSAGWPVTTSRTGEYNELTILLDYHIPTPSTVEQYVELVLLLLRAGCHPTLLDRFGDRPITRFGTKRISQHDVAPIYDVIFDRDDLDLGRTASNGSSALTKIRGLHRTKPDLANRALTWMTIHGQHIPFVGGDSDEPLII